MAESMLGSLLRNLTRTGARVGESLLGTPGDIGRAIQSLGQSAFEGATGIRDLEDIPLPPEIKERVSQLKQIIPPSDSYLSRVPASTQEIRQSITEPIAERTLPKDYLKPQSKGAERFDELISDITSFLHPIGGKGKLVGRAISPIAGNIAKWGAQEIGLGEGAQEGVKLGTMLLTHAGMGPRLRQRAQQLYKVAEENIPTDRFISSFPIEKIAEEGLQNLGRGDITPSKKFILERLGRLDNLIKGGKINAADAYQLTKDINEFFAEGMIPQKAQGFMGKLLEATKDVLKETAETHPDFYNAATQASDIWKSLNTNSQLAGVIKKGVDKVSKKLTSPFSFYLLGLPKAIGGSIIGESAKLGIDIFDRVARSPAARKAYGELLANASKDNIGATSRSILKLDKALAKTGPIDEEYEFIGTDKSPEGEFEFIGYDDTSSAQGPQEEFEFLGFEKS